jgi:hypothetical protein
MMQVRNLKGSKPHLSYKKVMRRFLLFLWIASLLSASILITNNQVQAQSSDKYSLQLQGFVWDHSTLNTLVITSDNESWWNPTFLNTTLRAIGQWNDAVATFSSNYTDFAYLSTLKIKPTVSKTSQPGFDIYVKWTKSSLSNITDELGLSQFFAKDKTIINSTISLAAQNNHGVLLSEGDMQNVALHEVGHGLGLGHANYTGDLMYAYYTTESSPKVVSTLDVYGVAKLFGWEKNSSRFYPVSGWLNESSVVLPQEIPYRGLPVSPENTIPQTFADNPVVQTLVLMFEILIHPQIFALVLGFIVVLVLIAIIPKKRKAAKPVKADS